ncbi:GNS1/SUR4 membrane protein [Amanita muscaria]
MAPLADFLVSHFPFQLPAHYTSYVPGKTPLSTSSSVMTTLISYLVVIFGIQAIMKDQKPQKLTTLFRAHNLILTSGSFILLALMVEEIFPLYWKNGLFHVLCSEESWTPRLEVYYIINYYFKYIELIDTVFLALKKKPLQFLHVFHHSATALLCFSQLNGRTSISWVVITLNLAVHVVMYYYYYATAGGARFWWKKYLTTMQIVQFIVDLFAVYFGTYSHYAFTYYKGILPSLGNCSATESAALFGCGLLTSYLGLFINFYIQTYKTPAKKGDTVVNGKANGNTLVFQVHGICSYY